MSSTPSSSTSTPRPEEEERKHWPIDPITGKRVRYRSHYDCLTGHQITIDYETGKRTFKIYPSDKPDDNK